MRVKRMVMMMMMKMMIKVMHSFQPDVSTLCWARNSACRLSVMLVHPTQRVEFFRNMFAPYCNVTIWLGCEENSAKINIHNHL